MKVKLLPIFLLLIITSLAPTTAQPLSAQAEIPYIYYYSQALNGVVIERADGTDSRIIGQGLVNEDVAFVYGPGWSADGRWFAWRTDTWTPDHYDITAGKGYIVSTDGQTNLNMLARFPCVLSMLTNPHNNIILIYGTLTKGQGCPQMAYPVASYWLIDADTQTRLATFSIDTSGEGMGIAPIIHWNSNQQQIQFVEETYIEPVGFQHHLITMAYNGKVTIEPITADKYASKPSNEPVGNAFEQNQQNLFTASGDKAIPISSPSNSSSAMNYAAVKQWDVSGQWILLGYEWCFTDCTFIGRVNIFNPTTGYNREISSCGTHPACVGWLPEQVNIEKLPPGQPTSVLPTPQFIDYDTNFWEKANENDYGYFSSSHIPTHELVCNKGTLSHVRNKVNGEIDFVLPTADSCPSIQVGEGLIYPSQPIIFALSPDKHYYAITDKTEYTALYDTATGQQIARLNFYGIELSFSADSHSLITMGRYATATWDIQTLIEQSLHPD